MPDLMQQNHNVGTLRETQNIGKLKNKMYDTLKSSNTGTISSLSNVKKITPGPYRATKLWNEIIHVFNQKMPRRRHRRHLKLYNNCFTASEAIDCLHMLLKQNHNIGYDVTRMQTTLLLRKFYKTHIIEDIHGNWGNESLHDDNHLYRFAPERIASESDRKPLSFVNENTLKNKISEKSNLKLTKKKKDKKKKDQIKDKFEPDRDSNLLSSSDSNSSVPLKKQALPPALQHKEISGQLTEDEINKVWREVLCENIKETLQLDTLNDIILPENINGQWIKHNITKVGQSGVVQVSKDQDLPHWALNAIACLANWPNGKNSGVICCYPGFENDIFKEICNYYCKSGKSVLLSTGLINVNAIQSCSSHDHFCGKTIEDPLLSSTEPLLTFSLYEMFTNIICLLKPQTHSLAVESLKLCLLLLPPANRRKLHLLLRLMAKMSINPHLSHMGQEISTRGLLLHAFSSQILSCIEEVYLDELLAMRLTSFLIDNHQEVMSVPAYVAAEVEAKLKLMHKSVAKYSDGNLDGSFIQCPQFPVSDIQLLQPLQSKCPDIAKSSVIFHLKDTLQSEPCLKETAKFRCSTTFNTEDKPGHVLEMKLQHRRSSTISSKLFNLKIKSRGEKHELKAARSCPNICDESDFNPLSGEELRKTSTGTFAASSHNLRILISRLRKHKS